MFFPLGMTAPLEEEDDTKPARKIDCALACIRKYPGASYCGRSPPDSEFMFTDRAYAAEHYDRRQNPAHTPRQSLSACEECIDLVRAALKREADETSR